jgi:signal transduction histidine kinase
MAAVKQRAQGAPETRSRARAPVRAPGVGAPAEIVLLDAEGVIVAVNQAWRATLKARGVAAANGGVGQAYVALARRFLPDLDEEGLTRSLAALTGGHAKLAQHAYAVETAKGPRWRQLQITPIEVGAEVCYVAIHEDLSELVRTQEALRRAAAELLTAQEDERQRIALELHDSTAQHLAALGLGVARLRRLTKGRQGQAVLDEMAESLREAVKETRVLSYLMKPTGLVREGLVVTARQFVAGFTARTGLDARFQAMGPVDAAPAIVQHAAFRILQEALSNVYRHAGARRVEVILAGDGRELSVRVADDGRGMDRHGRDIGVGIAGMRARAEQFAGRLEIASDEQGTRVEARLPAD